MTAITLTEREPLCDIQAQACALLAPDHPKRALWISIGTPRIKVSGKGIKYLDTHWGTLYASEHDCGRLEDDPSDEMLAELLDYTEPKSSIAAKPALWWPVVQARDARDCVVWEQVSSWDKLRETLDRGRPYGELAILTMGDVLHRRQRLIAKEEAARPRSVA